MSMLKNVAIAQVCPNPYRDLVTYPWIEPKIEALMRSIKEVGFWEGVIARKTGDKFEIAFGHHRIEAARRLKLTSIPLVVRSISDKEMLQFMGRENGEDYHTDFLVMLATWESAIRYISREQYADRVLESENETLKIARLLGWTLKHRQTADRSNTLALTCAIAIDLMAGEHITRDDLKGISCHAARELLSATRSQIQSVKKHQSIEEQPKQISAVKEAAKKSADQIRKGNVATKDIKGTVDSVSFGKRFQNLPSFYRYTQDLINMVESMLHNDAAAKRMEAVIEALPLLIRELDMDRVNVLCEILDELSARCNDFKKQIQGTYSKKTRRLEVVK